MKQMLHLLGYVLLAFNINKLNLIFEIPFKFWDVRTERQQFNIKMKYILESRKKNTIQQHAFLFPNLFKCVTFSSLKSFTYFLVQGQKGTCFN